MIGNAVVALLWGYAAARYAWPWDWLGRRRNVTLKRSRRPWE